MICMLALADVEIVGIGCLPECVTRPHQLLPLQGRLERDSECPIAERLIEASLTWTKNIRRKALFRLGSDKDGGDSIASADELATQVRPGEARQPNVEHHALRLSVGAGSEQFLGRHESDRAIA